MEFQVNLSRSSPGRFLIKGIFLGQTSIENPYHIAIYTCSGDDRMHGGIFVFQKSRLYSVQSTKLS